MTPGYFEGGANMSKTWLILLVAGVVVVALFMLIAVAAFVFFPQIQQSMMQPKGPVLVYEVDPDNSTPGQTVDMDKLAQAVDRRLNSRWIRLARVRELGNQRIEVAIREKGKAQQRRVEELLAHCGVLEFRILANTRDNKDLITQALADPSKTRIRNKDGTLAAWWASVKIGEERGLAGSSDIALRQRTRAGRQTTEVLVLNDDYNITGAYLKQVNLGADERGRLCIDFAFNNAGGQLFGELTGSHLPDRLTGFSYKLAIILDGDVYSAPSIQSKIRDRAQITGSFTSDEVDEIASLLNAGTLPAKIRPVKK
jgi:preprotein translocase subunit SecD